MRVNVFVTRVAGQLRNELLVLPSSPQTAIPAKYRTGWNYYATMDTGDRMFGQVGSAVLEAELATNGFATMRPIAPDRRMERKRSA